jgi:hypothetical protein
MNEHDCPASRASIRRTLDLRALILALGTFAIGTDAFIIGRERRPGRLVKKLWSGKLHPRVPTIVIVILATILVLK